MPDFGVIAGPVRGTYEVVNGTIPPAEDFEPGGRLGNLDVTIARNYPGPCGIRRSQLDPETLRNVYRTVKYNRFETETLNHIPLAPAPIICNELAEFAGNSFPEKDLDAPARIHTLRAKVVNAYPYNGSLGYVCLDKHSGGFVGTYGIIREAAIPNITTIKAFNVAVEDNCTQAGEMARAAVELAKKDFGSRLITRSIQVVVPYENRAHLHHFEDLGFSGVQLNGFTQVLMRTEADQKPIHKDSGLVDSLELLSIPVE